MLQALAVFVLVYSFRIRMLAETAFETLLGQFTEFGLRLAPSGSGYLGKKCLPKVSSQLHISAIFAVFSMAWGTDAKSRSISSGDL